VKGRITQIELGMIVILPIEDDESEDSYTLVVGESFKLCKPPEESKAEVEPVITSKSSSKSRSKPAKSQAKQPKNPQVKQPAGPEFKTKTLTNGDFDGSSVECLGVTFEVGDQVEFAIDSKGVVTHLGKQGAVLPVTEQGPAIPPVFRRLYSNEGFSSTSAVASKVARCALQDEWRCPSCKKKNLITSETCSGCSWTVILDEEVFKPHWGAEEYNGIRLLDLRQKQWKCPKCTMDQPWFDITSLKEKSRDCVKCKEPRPNPGNLAFNTVIDHDSFIWCFEPSGVVLTRIADYVASTSSTEHHSPEQLIAQGDKDFDQSLKHYTQKSHGCPHCELIGGTQLGCHDRSLQRDKRVSFSQWYGLSEGNSKRAVRMKELKTLLDGLPLCDCQKQHGAIGAVPKAPYNVFTFVTHDIDPGKKYWNNKAAPILVTNRPKLDCYQTISADEQMKCHIVPRSAGGCFLNSKNVIFIQHLCPTCQCLDKLFTLWQGDNEVPDELFEKKWCLDEATLGKAVSVKFAAEYLAARKERAEVISAMTKLFVKKM
jgi:hypothetical protein